MKDVDIKGQFSWKFSWTAFWVLQVDSVCSFSISFRVLVVGFAGYFIPQGWCVLASLTSVHMDESNYDNPYQFDPWRWEVSLANGTSSSPRKITYIYESMKHNHLFVPLQYSLLMLLL